MKTPLVIRYATWGMLIFAFSMGIYSFHGLRSLEQKSFELFRGTRSYGLQEHTDPGEVTPPLKVFPFYDNIPQEEFLKSAATIVKRLKTAGAKVIVVPLASGLLSNPSTLALIRPLASDSSVIFGVRLSMMYGENYTEPRLEDRENWWVRHPLYNTTKIRWGAMTEYTSLRSLLTRFIPLGVQDEKTGEIVPDVIVLALLRYFDLPENTDLAILSRRLAIGPYTFPIERDGLTYARITGRNNTIASLYATTNPATDSLEFFPMFARRMDDTAAVRAAWESYRGKIVIIEGNNHGLSRYAASGWEYADILRALFNHTFVTVHSEWNALLIAALVVLLTTVSYSLRNSLMVALSIALTIGTLAISRWLTISHNILFDPLYVVVPIILCGAILPIVKLAGEKRIAEERIQSLEAENKRLRDLRQPPPPVAGF
ncbi:MAG TPA: hypothetical protein VMH23_06945 [Bacteroidota bacterium]|nr:hypothetical protein [Bacteroidota bacterium]